MEIKMRPENGSGYDGEGYNAEGYVIAGMLINKTFALEARDLLNVNDFYDAFFYDCYSVSLEFLANGIEVSIDSILNRLNGKWSDCVKRLLALDAMGRGADLNFYLRLVKDNSLRRQLCVATERLAINARDRDVPTAEVINRMVNSGVAFELEGKDDDVATGQELLRDWVATGCRLSKSAAIPSGFAGVDELTHGFPKGQLVYLGARPHSGKTTLLIQFAVHAMVRGQRVGFISMEMSSERISKRVLCCLASVNASQALKHGTTVDEIARIGAAYAAGTMNRFYASSKKMKISQVKAWIRRQVVKNKVDIFYIDYLTLIDPDKRLTSKHHEIDQVSKGLQSIAKELNVPIVCAAQLNRGAADRRPTNADFRESGSIEEDADIILLLHRPDQADKNKKPGMAELVVSKNRDFGEVGMIDLTWRNGAYVAGDQRALSVAEVMGRHED